MVTINFKTGKMIEIGGGRKKKKVKVKVPKSRWAEQETLFWSTEKVSTTFSVFMVFLFQSSEKGGFIAFFAGFWSVET